MLGPQTRVPMLGSQQAGDNTAAGSDRNRRWSALALAAASLFASGAAEARVTRIVIDAVDAIANQPGYEQLTGGYLNAGAAAAALGAQCTKPLPAGVVDDWEALVNQAIDSDVLR